MGVSQEIILSVTLLNIEINSLAKVSSFLKINIKTIQDIWDENSKLFIDCNLLYSKLIDRINYISEYSKIKKCIPNDYLEFLKQ